MENEINSEDLFDDDKFKSISEAYEAAHETSITLTYEGSKVTFSKGDDVMVNATQMAKTFGKRPVDWLRLPTSKTFLEELSKVRKSHFEKLVKTQAGGANPGTWFHEDVAIEL